MCVVAPLLLAALAPGPIRARQLNIHHLDADQGDATLIVGPAGGTLSIGSGDDGIRADPQGAMTAGLTWPG